VDRPDFWWRLRGAPLVAGLLVAAAAALVACGASPAAPAASPIGSPTSIASYGPIGLPAIPPATIVTYTIRGSTAAELRAQMDQLGPQHFDAFTRWDFSWTWPAAADGSCILSKATVNYTIKVTAPVWTPPRTVDPSLVTAWSTYMTALATHEKGHIDFVVATAPSVLEAIKASTCDKANAAAGAVLDRIRQHDIAYDAATNHGATQGARFPLGASGGGA
jgi:predicted secreted Zn-dependent protease